MTICENIGLDLRKIFGMDEVSKFVKYLVEVSDLPLVIGVFSTSGVPEFVHKDRKTGSPVLIYLVYSFRENPHFIRINDAKTCFGDAYNDVLAVMRKY